MVAAQTLELSSPRVQDVQEALHRQARLQGHEAERPDSEPLHHGVDRPCGA